METFDYVIVGAGSAGCVLASRLSEDPQRRVLLLEAGGADRHPFIHMPRGLVKMLGNPRYTWPFMTQAGVHGASEFWTRGRTLGGSSSINGMMYVRGQAADFEALAAATSDDWSWQYIGAAYKALESHELGAGATRGDQGPLRISLPQARGLLSDRVIEACAAMGMQVVGDVNDPADAERVGYAQATIFRGRRQSAAVAFLGPAGGRPNLKVVTGALIDKVLFEGRHARGVSATLNGSAVTFHAAQEVLLCAGTLASPAILQRSGIGPADYLRGLGLEVVHDNAGVGANLREHRGIVMQWSVEDRISENREYRGARLAANVARYYTLGGGPMAKPAFDIGAWFKTRPGAQRPDGQLLLSAYSFDYSRAKPGVEPSGGLIGCVYNLRPQSTGTVLIRSGSPEELPIIQPNYGAVEADLSIMVDLVRYARRLIRQAPLARLVQAETRPGAQYESDEQIREAHRQFGYTNYHACGTCRMGNDEDAVLDPKLRVRGVEGLRVIDASMFPFMLSGNINAPVIATAWRAADLIAGTG